MAEPARHHLVAHLPPSRGWRRALHVERAALAPRAVVLAFPPPEIADDPARLAALARDAEAVARLQHPHVTRVLGLETVGDAVALCEAWSDGVTLAELLDAGGRLPPDVAGRVAADAALGLAAIHAADAGDGTRLAHGALALETVRVGADGAAAVTGAGGAAGSGSVAGDLAALGRVLHALLAGEPPASPPRALEAPGIPATLARVVDALVGVAGAPPAPGSALACAEALAAALPLAPREGVAAYVDAIVPPEEGERADRARRVAAALGSAPQADAADDLIVGEPTPAAFPAPAPAARPAAPPAPPPAVAAAPARRPAPPPPDPEPTPRPDAAQFFPAPAPPPPAGGPPWLAATLGLLAGVALGAALGFAILDPGWARRADAPALEIAREPAPAAPEVAGGAAPTSRPAESPAPAPVAGPAAPAPARERPAAPAPKPAPPSIAITAEPPADVYVNGKRAGRAPVTVPVPAGTHEVRLKDPARGIDAVRRVAVRSAATPVRFALGRGTLTVNAPDAAEVWVDGRRAGKGSVQVELWEGTHKVEARLGTARTGQTFSLGPGETWTYDVSETRD